MLYLLNKRAVKFNNLDEETVSFSITLHQKIWPKYSYAQVQIVDELPDYKQFLKLPKQAKSLVSIDVENGMKAFQGFL